MQGELRDGLRRIDVRLEGGGGLLLTREGGKLLYSKVLCFAMT
jgi:hypothetical protein